MKLKNTNVEVRGQSKQLAVLVHGYTHSSKKLHHVRDALAEMLPDVDLLVPDCPIGRFSNVAPVEITEDILSIIDAAIDDREKRGGSYQEVIFIGHSCGALLLRKAYVFARGQTQDSAIGLTAKPRKWVSLVSRIILLAGMNRGWSVSPKPKHMSWVRCLVIRFSIPLLRRLPIAKFIKGVARGAPFIVNLRIQWINLGRRGNSLPTATIQVLGNTDDVVSREDNIDIQSGSGFVYLRMPDTGHLNAIDFSGDMGHRRKQVFVRAITTDPQTLESDFETPFTPKPEIEHVVFVMHGIRDRGFWTEHLRDLIEKITLPNGKKCKAIPSSYGRMPMLPFLLFSERQKNVRWFMDQYTEALAEYPRAKMGFIGHSNGTYLLASALERYKACWFHRIVFAGSVVPTDFAWDHHVKNKRVEAIRNYIATSDWVVGVFPGFYESIGLSDLGSAGHNGFRDDEGKRHAVTFIKGEHNAAIAEDNYDAMIRFVIDGGLGEVPGGLLAEQRNTFVVVTSRFNWVVWIILTGIIISLAIIIALHFEPFWLLVFLAVLYISLHSL